jgi:hypothetical protein
MSQTQQPQPYRVSSMTPRGHFVSLTKQLKNYSRYNDADGLEAYLAGPAWEHFLALQDDAASRLRASRAMIMAAAKCRTALDAKAPLPRPGKRRIQWDAATIARFKKALQKGGTEGAARALGISMDAAARARRRYCQEPLQQKTS